MTVLTPVTAGNGGFTYRFGELNIYLQPGLGKLLTTKALNNVIAPTGQPSDELMTLANLFAWVSIIC